MLNLLKATRERSHHSEWMPERHSTQLKSKIKTIFYYFSFFIWSWVWKWESKKFTGKQSQKCESNLIHDNIAFENERLSQTFKGNFNWNVRYSCLFSSKHHFPKIKDVFFHTSNKFFIFFFVNWVTYETHFFK
jgi:hypothetical protein